MEEQKTRPRLSRVPRPERSWAGVTRGRAEQDRFPALFFHDPLRTLQMELPSQTRALHFLLLLDLSVAPKPQAVLCPGTPLTPPALPPTVPHCVSAETSPQLFKSFFMSIPSSRVPVIPPCSTSSANFTNSLSYKSLIKIKNRLKRKTGPFGTPLKCSPRFAGK